LITSSLHQDVEHDAVLIDGSPQPVLFAADLQQQFVEVPFIAASNSSSTQPSREERPEHCAPLADRLVADDDAALSEQILHVAETEVKAKVEPDGVSDDLGREAVAAIRRSFGSGLGDGHQPRLIADPRST
jgi:hypothetical protein